VCPEGQHLHQGVVTHDDDSDGEVDRTKEMGWFCADDACNCSKFHRCAGPEDVMECPPPPNTDLQECKPKYHCWYDASGYKTCRRLHSSNCSDTNSTHCNCFCPVPETRHQTPYTPKPSSHPPLHPKPQNSRP